MSIPYVTDGETDLDSALFNPIIDGVNNATSAIADLEASVSTGSFLGDPLSRWRRGGFAGKTICFVGDSTTSHAFAMYDALEDVHASPSGTLATLTDASTDILNYGENGCALSVFLDDGVTHGITATIAAAADLYVLCYGINDVRLGATDQDELEALIVEAVVALREGVPDADIVLRIPNSLLTVDVGDEDFVSPETAEAAQAYTDILRGAYLAMANRWPNVLVWDAMSEIFGTICQASSPYMLDQLHPNDTGYELIAAGLAQHIGIAPAGVIPAVLPAGEELASVATGPVQVVIDEADPWELDPNVLRDTRYFRKVAEADYANQGAKFVDFTWPGAFASEIQENDIVAMGDCVPWQIVAPTFIGNPGGGQTRIAITADLPTNTVTAGVVRVYRRVIGDSTIMQYNELTSLYPYRKFGTVNEAGNNFIRLKAGEGIDQGDARRWSVADGDVLVIAGETPLTLASITQSPSGAHLQIAMTHDFTGTDGKQFGLFGNHLYESGVERTVSVDPASVSAGAVGETSVTVTDATVEHFVVVRPPTSLDAGIVYSAFVSAADTVTLRLYNGTGSPIDVASADWRFLLMR